MVASFLFVIVLCNKNTYKYEIEYVSMFNGVELGREKVSEYNNKKIKYDAPEIVGYKFVGWEDGESSKQRTDNKRSKSVIVANYEMEFLDTPVVIINTENSQVIDQKENYVNCEISITNTEEEFCKENVAAGIKGRGHSTWANPKKPYKIKFDTKQSLFGSSYKQKSWTLLANYSDKTLSRNAIAYEMSKVFDDITFSSIHQFVEVYMNNEYLGVYLLCDQIQTGDGRVDVDEELYDDYDTGYLIEIESRSPSKGVLNKDYFEMNGDYYALKTPDPEDEDINIGPYVEFIKEYFINSFNAISEGNWASICEFIDVNSFADVYIIQELFSNADVGFSSFYFYKDRHGKLYCGPIWDFDLSAGN